MAHKIFTYDTSKTTGGRNTNKATAMIKQTEISLLENKKQAPFTGYTPANFPMKESFVSTKTGENSTNESFSLGKFVSHSDLEQRDKALMKFIQENVSKQITHAIEKFKSGYLKEFIEKSLDSFKEELEHAKKTMKTHEEALTQLQTEKVNYEQTLKKIEEVLERQFASVTAGSFASLQGANSNENRNETVNSLKEDVKNIQNSLKTLKESILTQINEQLTEGLSTLSQEQAKIHEKIENFSRNREFPGDFHASLQSHEANLARFSQELAELRRENADFQEKLKELHAILKEKREGVVYEVNIADADRFKFMEGRIEGCLNEIFKAKEQFEETLARKLDCETFETFKKQEILPISAENQEICEKNGGKTEENAGKYHIESVKIVTEREEKKEEVRVFVENQENLEENKADYEKNLPISVNNFKDLRKSEENDQEKREYEHWLKENRETVEQNMENSAEKERNPKEIKQILEGEEVISEIKQKDEDLNSEIQRDFESINNAMGNYQENQKIMPESPERKKNVIKNQGSESIENEEEGDGEIVYNIDENGFLIDESGNYILDDDGKMVKLSPEHIEYLRESNLYEEEFITN